MEWQKIYSFYKVVNHGSFTRGAEAVFRTQSAISQQINSLEIELGFKLFERPIRRGLKLTHSGEKVFIFADEMLKKYEQMLGELKAIKNLHQGPLKIGAPYNILRSMLSEKLCQYSQAYPLVELTIYDRPPKNILELLDQGYIDIGVVLESITPKNFSASRWKPMERFLIVPLDHPLASLEPSAISLEKIADYPLVSYPKNLNYTSRTLLEKMLYKAGIQYRISMEASTTDLAVQYVKNGMGVHFTILQKNLSGIDQTDLQFLPLSHLFEPEYLALVTRNINSLLPYQRNLIEFLIEKTT